MSASPSEVWRDKKPPVNTGLLDTEDGNSTCPVIVPPAFGNAALAVVLAELAVLVVVVNIPSLVDMSTPSTVPVTVMLPPTSKLGVVSL